jgi:hypothetical protein
MIDYFAKAPAGRLILWGYLIWYLTVAVIYFDTNWHLWANSLGISMVVGVALVLSTSPWPLQIRELNRWQVMRLFLMPFCVSSYSALIKGQGFVFLFPPSAQENALGFGLVATLVVLVFGIKRIHSRKSFSL